MFSRNGLLICSATALTAPSFAGQPPRRVLHLAQRPQFVQPDRAAQCEYRDGRIVLTSDWVSIGGTTRNPPNTYAYDAYESDQDGNPTDDAPFGCTSSLPLPGSRWYFGGTYNNPFWSNDMTTSSAGMGAECQGLNVAWWWSVDPQSDYDDSDGDGRLDQDCYMSVFTSETCDVQTCLDDGTGSLLPGVIYAFVDLDTAENPLGFDFFYANIDLTGLELSHPMPADGVGGTIVMYGTAYDPVSGEITLTAGVGDVWAQPMLWGTDEDEPPGGSTRVGTQESGMYEIDPDNPPSNECYDYSFDVCPDPLAPSIGFLYKGVDPCPCDGDTNADGVVDALDLTDLLAFFGAPCPCTNPCVDVNEDNVVDIADLSLLLSRFGGGCP